MSTTSKTWKCKCGKFQIKLHGDPIYSFNCHCHSCTAASRFITDKYPNGTSQLSDTVHNTGSAMSIWHMKDIDFFQGSPYNNLGYVKVGEKGSMLLRSYTKCCGTQAFTSGKNLPFNYRHFNRNCVYNEDGTKFAPENVPNIMVSYAFDPSVISEPRYKFIPAGALWVIISNTIKTQLGMENIGKLAEEPSMWVKAEDVDEIVPITWE